MFSFQDQITCTFIKLYAIYNIFMLSSTSIFKSEINNVQITFFPIFYVPKRLILYDENIKTYIIYIDFFNHYLSLYTTGQLVGFLNLNL